MTKQYLIDRIDDLKNEIASENVTGANELTIENVIYGLNNLITTLKNDES